MKTKRIKVQETRAHRRQRAHARQDRGTVAAAPSHSEKAFGVDQQVQSTAKCVAAGAVMRWYFGHPATSLRVHDHGVPSCALGSEIDPHERILLSIAPGTMRSGCGFRPARLHASRNLLGTIVSLLLAELPGIEVQAPPLAYDHAKLEFPAGLRTMRRALTEAFLQHYVFACWILRAHALVLADLAEALATRRSMSAKEVARYFSGCRRKEPAPLPVTQVGTASQPAASN